MPNNFNWCSVCYGDGKFVAINRYATPDSSPAADTGIAAYSKDGITWT